MKIKMRRNRNTKIYNALKGKVSIKSGFFGSDNGKSSIDNEGGIDMVNLAVTLNDGTNRAGRGRKVRIPPRPFLEISAIHIRKKSKELLNTELPKVLEGKKKLKDIGLDIAKENKSIIKRNIKNTSSPSNAPLTVAKKGFNNPLIHTKDMLKRVGSQLNNGKTIGIGDET